MRDRIQLNTDQIVEIREKAKSVNLDNPVIALPAFDLDYQELRQRGANYILSYNYDEENKILRISLKFADDRKEEFVFYSSFTPNEEKEGYYIMYCYEEEDNRLDEYWKTVLDKADDNEEENPKKLTAWQALTYDFFIINSYIAYYNQDDLFDLEEKVVKLPVKKSNNKKRSGKNNTVRMYRCYKLKWDWQKAKKTKRPHRYMCEAWGVRGHFRHYQNGKTIFIHAYVKGKDKENYKGKEYKLIGG